MTSEVTLGYPVGILVASHDFLSLTLKLILTLAVAKGALP